MTAGKVGLTYSGEKVVDKQGPVTFSTNNAHNNLSLILSYQSTK